MDLQQYQAAMDPDLRSAYAAIGARYQSMPKDPVARRAAMQAQRPPAAANERVPVEARTIPGPAGAPEVPVRIYRPPAAAASKGAVPGVLWIHGGGFTGGSAAMNDGICQRIVEEAGCLVVSVDYRLSPEHPFPAPPEDCYAALRWLAASAAALGVDAVNIAVAGQSAGGGLAAAVALLARDRGEVALSFQLLIYPCLDDRHITPSSHQIASAGMVWERSQSFIGWGAYLGEGSEPGAGDGVSPYAAPARVADVTGLAPAFLMVGELDLMRDETVEYALRLMQAGVPAELHVYPGAFHGFEIMVPDAPISRRATDEYVAALARALVR